MRLVYSSQNILDYIPKKFVFFNRNYRRAILKDLSNILYFSFYFYIILIIVV